MVRARVAQGVLIDVVHRRDREAAAYPEEDGSTGGSANVKFKNVGGTDVKNITNGCWVDGGDAFPSNAVALSGELTGRGFRLPARTRTPSMG